MPLKNFQYNKILRDYDAKQLESKHNLDLRTEEIYKTIPEMKEIDDKVISSSIESARLLLYGDEDALNSLKKITKDASKKRAQLLEEYGYPKDFLQPAYHCPDCKDTG